MVTNMEFVKRISFLSYQSITKLLPSALLLAAPFAMTAALAASSAARDYTGSMVSGGLTRTYLVHVPAKANSLTRLPLVIVMHGGNGTGPDTRDMSGMSATADTNKFVVVYPNGHSVDPGGVNGGQNWADGRGATGVEQAGVNDVLFISQLIDRLATETPINKNKVYATGISNGGMMSIRLACELSNKIVAIAPVAANMPQNLSSTCRPPDTVPAMFIHGDADTFIPAAGGTLTKGDGGVVLSTAASVTFFNSINGCQNNPTPTPIRLNPVNDLTAIDYYQYSGCAAGGETRFYNVINGGHTWPGGQQYAPVFLIGRTSGDMKASNEIWAFFSQFSF